MRDKDIDKWGTVNLPCGCGAGKKFRLMIARHNLGLDKPDDGKIIKLELKPEGDEDE